MQKCKYLATYNSSLTTPPPVLPLRQSMKHDIGGIGQKGEDHGYGEIDEDQLAGGTEFLLLEPLSLLPRLPDGAGKWFSPGTGDGWCICWLGRLGREDAVGEEGRQEDDQNHPGVIEVNELQHRRC